MALERGGPLGASELRQALSAASPTRPEPPASPTRHAELCGNSLLCGPPGPSRPQPGADPVLSSRLVTRRGSRLVIPSCHPVLSQDADPGLPPHTAARAEPAAARGFTASRAGAAFLGCTVWGGGGTWRGRVTSSRTSAATDTDAAATHTSAAVDTPIVAQHLPGAQRRVSILQSPSPAPRAAPAQPGLPRPQWRLRLGACGEGSAAAGRRRRG